MPVCLGSLSVPRLLHGTLRLRLDRRQHRVKAIHQFEGRRWRERQAMGDLDHGLLPLYWPFTCFFERDPKRSKRKTDAATIEVRAEKLVGVGLDNGSVVLNAKIRLLLFCHG